MGGKRPCGKAVGLKQPCGVSDTVHTLRDTLPFIRSCRISRYPVAFRFLIPDFMELSPSSFNSSTMESLENSQSGGFDSIHTKSPRSRQESRWSCRSAFGIVVKSLAWCCLNTGTWHHLTLIRRMPGPGITVSGGLSHPSSHCRNRTKIG